MRERGRFGCVAALLGGGLGHLLVLEKHA